MKENNEECFKINQLEVKTPIDDMREELDNYTSSACLLGEFHSISSWKCKGDEWIISSMDG